MATDLNAPDFEGQEPNRKPGFNKHRQKDIKTVYSDAQLVKSIVLPINAIGKKLHQTIEETMSAMLSGKCIVEGYVKPGSVKIITYSSGLIKGENVIFDVIVKLMACIL